MKILIISTSDFKGGAAKCAYRLGKSFIESGNEVLLYVQKKTLQEDWIVESKLSHVRKKIFHVLDRLPGVLLSGDDRIPFTLGFWGENLDQVIEDFNPDIINFHWTGKGFVSFQELVRQSMNHICVWTLHDWNYFSDGSFFKIEDTDIMDSFPGNLLARWNQKRKERLTRGKAFNIVTPSIFLAKELKKSKILSNSEVTIINNGIDTSIFKGKLQEKNKSFHKYILFGAADLENDRAKGFDLLVDSLYGIKSWLEESNIGLMCFGASNPFVTTRLSEINVPKISYGYINNEKDMSSIFSKANILVFTSRIENYPFVILECLASNTPVVAFAVGGIPEIINNPNLGVTVEPFDVNKMGESIKDLLEEDVQIPSETIQKYSIEKCSEEYLKLFNRIKV